MQIVRTVRQGLSVQHKDRFLTLVDDELGHAVEVLIGVLPHKGAVVPLVLDHVCNMRHFLFPPQSIYMILLSFRQADVLPIGHVASASTVVTHSHYRAVRLQAHRVI